MVGNEVRTVLLPSLIEACTSVGGRGERLPCGVAAQGPPDKCEAASHRASRIGSRPPSTMGNMAVQAQHFERESMAIWDAYGWQYVTCMKVRYKETYGSLCLM